MTRESKDNSDVNKMHNMQVYLHMLGEPTAKDKPILGAGLQEDLQFLPQEFPFVISPKDSKWALGFGAGARAESRVFVVEKDSLLKGQHRWAPLFEYSDAMEGWSLNGDEFYYRTTKNAPNGKIMKLTLGGEREAAALPVVPEQAGVLTGFVVKNGWLYFSMDYNGKSQLFKQALMDGEPIEIALPFIGQLALSGDSQKESAFHFSLEGWTRPRTYFEFVPSAEQIRPIGIGSKSDVDYSNVIVETLEAKSHDGVMVPVTVIRPKNIKLNGKNPTIVSGYGGYGFTIKPRFSTMYKPWYEQGGVLAFAHVRGSGVKGKQWHLDGKGVNKKNGVQDFIAVTKHLIDQGYTSSENVAASGGSMGGVLIGRAITEAPELFDASAIYVGMLNTIRFLESDNGANQTSELTATPDTKAGFEILLAMDSYHNIKPNTDYPATMLVVGLNDQRVSPWESAKFAAKMQAVASEKTKILLRAKDSEGHGVGSTKDQRFLSRADVFSFFLREFDSE